MANDKATDAVILIMIETVLTAQALGVEMEPMRGVAPVCCWTSPGRTWAT